MMLLSKDYCTLKCNESHSFLTYLDVKFYHEKCIFKQNIKNLQGTKEQLYEILLLGL